MVTSGPGRFITAGNSLQYLLCRRLGGHHSRSVNSGGRQKNLLLLKRSETRVLGCKSQIFVTRDQELTAPKWRGNVSKTLNERPLPSWSTVKYRPRSFAFQKLSSYYQNFEVLMKSDQINVIKPKEMGGHVACIGLKNLGNMLVVKPERIGWLQA